MMPASTIDINVMLVDDHKTMLWGLERLIGGPSTGMRVVATASNQEEALARAAETEPDVILLDLDLDGFCSLDILPRLLENGSARALIFTGARDQALLDRAVLGGARGVLRKDAPAELVMRSIEKVHQGELWLDHEMMARVFGEMTRPRSAHKADPDEEKQALLTAKERKIAAAIVAGNGMTNKALAESLFISEHTLRNYLVSMYKKLGVSNRLELYVYASRHPIATHSA